MGPEQGERLRDRRLELLVGNLLRFGVLVASVVVLLGGALYLVKWGPTAPNYEVFHGEPAELRSVSGIVRQTLDLRARAAIQLGLLLLIATPVLRVAVSMVAFALERDKLYTAVAAVVLVGLLYSLFGVHP